MENNEENQTEAVEDEIESFELKIDFSKYPSRKTKYSIQSLVERLQEHYRSDLNTIAHEIINQFQENNLLSDNKEEDLDDILIHLEDQEIYASRWFSISEAEGVVRFLSGGCRRESSEADIMLKDLMDEIENIMDNEEYYKK